MGAHTVQLWPRYTYGEATPRVVWLMRETDDAYVVLPVVPTLSSIEPDEERLLKSEWTTEEQQTRPVLPSLEDSD